MSATKPILVSEIIEKHIAAVGGREGLSKVKSRTYEGAIKAQGMAGRIWSATKAPGKFYQLVDFGALKQETGFDGTTGWKKDRNVVTILSGEALEQARESEVRNKILHYDDETLFSGVRLLCKEKVQGKEAFAVEYTYRGGNTIIRYYDAEIFLELKSVRYALIKSSKIKREIFNEDYRRVDDLILPFKVKQITPVNQVEIIIDYYKLNADIDDNIFKVPTR